ncbi:MAG: hypothetical protein IE925_14000 [Rhodobacterales bacterium]|jgi:hypothetical protein|nr:hypothetical protein [Rhodobacterales bacterium]
MLVELKPEYPIVTPAGDDPLARIVEGQPTLTARPANDDRSFRPCLLERRRRRTCRRTAH